MLQQVSFHFYYPLGRLLKKKIYIIDSDGKKQVYDGGFIPIDSTLYIPTSFWYNFKEWVTPIGLVISAVYSVIKIEDLYDGK